MAFNFKNKSFKSEYLDFFPSLEVKTWKNEKIGKFSSENITPQRPFKCSFKEACKKGSIEFKLGKEKRIVYMDNGVSIEFESHTLEEVNENDDIGLGFIVALLNMRCWPKVNNPNDIYIQYYDMCLKYRGSQSDKMFKNDFLVKENEYYLYTKEKLFPFFNEEECEYIKNRTREFFEYAREQGCVGEFVEDDVYKIDERLIKVDKILSTYKYEDKIDDYNIELIKDAIQHFIYDNRIEIGVDIAKLKKGENIDFTYYLMTSCFFAIYSENYNSADRERWCRLCGALFDKTQKTWNAHWNDNSKISREFMRKIESYYK